MIGRRRRALGTGLALGFNANRWKIFATVAVALVLIRAYPSDDGRVETVRSFSVSTRSS